MARRKISYHIILRSGAAVVQKKAFWAPKNSTFFNSGQIWRVDWNWPSALFLHKWFFFVRFLLLKKYKINHILKTKNRTQKVIRAKNERQINSNLPHKFGHFWKKLKFWGAFWLCLGVCGSQTRYDVICNFAPIFFLAHCA